MSNANFSLPLDIFSCIVGNFDFIFETEEGFYPNSLGLGVVV
jgi:hypothetical protein